VDEALFNAFWKQVLINRFQAHLQDRPDKISIGPARYLTSHSWHSQLVHAISKMPTTGTIALKEFGTPLMMQEGS
jgi:hypothetical protein